MNTFVLFRCCICDAIFFDLKELKQHYFKSQQFELDKINSIKSANGLNRPLTNSQVNRRIIYKHLKQKHMAAFNKKNFKFLNSNNDDENMLSDNESLMNELFVDVLNNLSFKKLQFSTRCASLANMNLINLNYQFFRSAYKITGKPSSPHLLVCPECGISFDCKTQAEKFRLHLVYGCLFTMKYDCGQMKCPSCFLICESINEFVAHWSKSHVRAQHECELCDRKGIKVVLKDDNHSAMHSSCSSTSSTPDLVESGHEHKTRVGSSSNLHEPAISETNMAFINKHYLEKHRNQQISLKFVYNCLCKSIVPEESNSKQHHHSGNRSNNFINIESNEDANESLPSPLSNSSECIHTTWKSCHSHIISIIQRNMASLNCLICNKLIENEKYQGHLKLVHNLDKILICPLCGIFNE